MSVAVTRAVCGLSVAVWVFSPGLSPVPSPNQISTEQVHVLPHVRLCSGRRWMAEGLVFTYLERIPAEEVTEEGGDASVPGDVHAPGV